MKPSRIVGALLACAVTASIFAVPTLGPAFKEMAFVKVMWAYVVEVPASKE